MTRLWDNSKKRAAARQRSWRLFSWRKKLTLWRCKTSMIFIGRAFLADNSKKRQSSAPERQPIGPNAAARLRRSGAVAGIRTTRE